MIATNPLDDFVIPVIKLGKLDEGHFETSFQIQFVYDLKLCVHFFFVFWVISSLFTVIRGYLMTSLPMHGLAEFTANAGI